ncbi:hypothetical protein SUGI_0976170 [Cryptomeria japonica]|nr:hypothetical protein SUGI_0976170 [Cryptomeria japonica]
MAGNNCEDELDYHIVEWKSFTNVDCQMESRPKCGLNHLRMSGLVWLIEILPLLNTMDYTFNIIEVKRSKSPLHLSKPTAPDLLAKFNLLLVELQTYIRSVFRVEELLDKLYACSCLLSMAENNKGWWIIVDAEIIAVACKTAREAAKAAAALITDELCATERWNGIAGAVAGGFVLQWCKLQFLEERMIPCFEFEVAVQDFLQGNDVISSHALKVTVYLEDDISVICSQEGVETETSSVLGLLRYLIRNYIMAALERNEGEHGTNNIVQGLLQHVVWYIFEARKGISLDDLALTWASGDLWRREGYVRNSLSNTEVSHQELSNLLLTDDVDDDWNEIDDGNENTKDEVDDDGNENTKDEVDDDGNESAEEICSYTRVN